MTRESAERFDVAVVGGGPAGLSAALILGRCRRRVVVCDDASPRNAASRAVHGLLGHDGIAPAELRRICREQLAPYDVHLADDTVVRATRTTGGFELEMRQGPPLAARRLLLATGLRDRAPDVEGLRARMAVSVFPCPYCDGWEHRDQALGLLARCDDAADVAAGLLTWSDDVVLFTDGPADMDGAERARLDALGVTLIEDRVIALEGPGAALERVVLEGGRSVARDVLFFKAGCAQVSDLAQSLGCRLTSNGEVEADPCGRTGVEGVYVAGDATPQAKLAVVAAAEGAQAGIEIHRSLREEDQQALRERTRAGIARPALR